MAKPYKHKPEKEFIVEMEVTGRWIERYTVLAKDQDEAISSWESGEYIESYEYQPDTFDFYECYEY